MLPANINSIAFCFERWTDSHANACAGPCYLTQLDGWKVGWRSFQEQWFDSCGPFKDAVISIMASLAEQERITISERTKPGLKRTEREGTKLGRPVVNVDMKLVRKWRAKGESLRAIANPLRVSPAVLVKRAKDGRRSTL
jgi:DNA invertase Pin-like site-specific DNA recombinase